jgi:glutathione synthase/RimK-type ligase-like ATP-grasp enzyme
VHADSWLPVLVKPIAGHSGTGVQVLHSSDELAIWLDGHWATSPEPILIQPFISFSREWRVLLLQGRSLGIVEKFQSGDLPTRNASTGATFRIPEDDCSWVERHVQGACPDDCFLGVDVAQAPDERLHIIEANYAPQFAAFEQATTLDVSDSLLRSLLERLPRGIRTN